MIRLPISKARFDPVEILYQVVYGGEHIIIHRHEKDIAAVISLQELELLEKLKTHRSGQEQITKALFQLAAIVESSDDAIIGKTLDGVITSWNPGAEHLYGYAAKEVIGKNISLLIPHHLPNEVPQILEKISKGERVDHYETVRVSKDGREINISLTISPIRDSLNNVIGAATIARDITQSKKAEEELKNSREQLRILSSRLQSLQENERFHITQEIQEDFGQALTAFKLDLAWLSKKLPINQFLLQNKIYEMSQLLDSTFKNIQKVSTELRPKMLDDLGLIAAIEWEVSQFKSRTGINCDLIVPEEELTLDQYRSISIFRILQESLNKFSSFTNTLTIFITWSKEILTLELIDNTQQTNGSPLVKMTSFDLLEIKERALSLQGELQTFLKNGKTSLIVKIPFPKQSVIKEEKIVGKSSKISLHNSQILNKDLRKNLNIITTLVADNHAIVREGLKQILTETPDISVEGEATNALELLELIRTNHWDIVIMDFSLPEKNGLDLLKQIKTEYPQLPVLVLSSLAEEQYVLRVLKAGASGCLNKESAPEQLIRAVRKVAQGGQYVSESVAEKIIFDFRIDKENPLHKKLSDREFQIFSLIALGKSLTEIANELHLSIKTVSTYRSKLLQKLEMKNNVELAHYAIEQNLLPK